MSTILEKGKTLLVEGPASVVVKGGKITALGTLLPVGKVIVVRKGKALPFEVEEDGQLNVTTGGDRGPLLLDGSTIPESCLLYTSDAADE